MPCLCNVGYKLNECLLVTTINNSLAYPFWSSANTTLLPCTCSWTPTAILFIYLYVKMPCLVSHALTRLKPSFAHFSGLVHLWSHKSLAGNVFSSLLTLSLSGELLFFLQVPVQVCGFDEALSSLSPCLLTSKHLRCELQTSIGFCWFQD